MGSVRSSPAALEFCCGGPHSVVAGILQFFDHLAEISGPWQLVPKEMCVIGQQTVSHFVFVPHFYELGHYAAKFRGKLIVFGSAVFDNIRNHIASVAVSHFFVCFCFFSFLQMITFFYICWDWAQSLILLCFIDFCESLNPNTLIPTHLFGFCPSLS